MQEGQREQQKAENKAASFIIDLREKINAGKRAREETEQSNSTTTPTPVAPAASPTQPQARKQRVTRELLTSAEIQQLDITARDFVRQRPGRFDQDCLQSKNYARNPITILPMGKDLLQKTRTAFLVDSTIKSSYNSHNTLMDVRILNMPFTSRSKLAEVTDNMSTPAATKTIPHPPLQVYSNVIGHLALRGTLEFFEPGHERLTEGFMTDEVTNYVETMAHIARFMRNKKATTGTVFMSSPGYVYLPLPLQQFVYLVTEAAYARELSLYIVAPKLHINSTTWPHVRPHIQPSWPKLPRPCKHIPDIGATLKC